MKKCLLFIGVLAALCPFLSVSQASEFSAPAQDRAKETIMFVPEKAMPLVYGKEQEGIFVSYQEYRTLYEKARDAYLKKVRDAGVPDALRSPVLVQANYTGTVEDSLLKLSGEFHVFYNGEEPGFFSFPLKDVFYQSAVLNGKKALIQDAAGGPRVLLPGKGAYDLTVHFLVPIKFSDENGQASFSVPPALFGDIRLKADNFYDIRFPALTLTAKNPLGESTEFMGFLQQNDTVSIKITNRRSSGEKKVQISSREEHQAFLSQDLIEQVSHYNLDVRYGEITGVDIRIAPGVHVHEVSGPGIAGWSRENSGGTSDVLRLQFYLPLSGEIRFALKTYQYPEAGAEPLRLMDSRIENLFDRKGSLKIYYDDSVRVEALETRFLLPAVGPHNTGGEKGRYSLYTEYQIFNLPYEISLARLAVPRQVLVEQHNDLEVGESKILFNSELALSGLTPGTAQFLFQVPEGYEVNELSVYVNGDPVQEHHEHRPGDNTLRVDIRHPITAKDNVVLLVRAERLVGEGSLRDQPRPVAIPVLIYPEAGKMTGTLNVQIDEMYLLTDILLSGYSPAEEMLSSEPDEAGGKKLLYDFRSLSPKGEILISLRQAEQTSKTVSFIAVDENLLETNTYIRYSITSGKKDSFYFAIPQWPGSKINIEGEYIKEKKKVPLERVQELVGAAGLPDMTDYDIWNVVLQKEASREVTLAVDYQKKIDRFEALFDVPLVVPLDVLSDTGYIVLEASKNTKITTEKSGLNELETYEIPQWPAYKPSNRIIESLRYFTRPFTFRVAVNRMDESPVLASLAEDEELVYVFGANSEVFFEGHYRIKNTNLQFLQVELPDRFVFWGATLDGKGVKPRKGSGRLIFIPLPVDSDQTIAVRLTGQLERNGHLGMFETFDLRGPQLGIPVLQSHMTVYYPEQYSLLNMRGNFEKYPQPEYQRPLFLSFLSGAAALLGDNIGQLIGPYYFRRGIQGRLKSAADDIGEQFSPGNTALQSRVRDASQYLNEQTVQQGATLQYEPYYLETNYDLEREPVQPADEAVNALSPQARPAPDSLPQYGRRKGLLSLNIDVPKEGESLSAHKLWGGSRLKVTFISGAWKRFLGLVSALAFIGLGFYVQRRGFMAPGMYFIMIFVLGTFVPMVLFRSYLFMFNGAMCGAGVFLALLLAGRYYRKVARHLGMMTVLALTAGLFLISACPDACAEQVSSGRISFKRLPVEAQPPDDVQAPAPFSQCAFWQPETTAFPDIMVYVPYHNPVPFVLSDSQKVFIPTEDYFRLKLLAEPPYEAPRRFDYASPFDLTGLSLQGTLDGDVVRFTAVLDIFVNNEEWLLVPVPFDNVFMRELRLDGQAVPVMMQPPSGECLGMCPKRTGTPGMVQRGVYGVPVRGLGHHTLALDFLVEVDSLLGKKTLAFGFPPAVLSDFSLDLRSRDVFIEFEEPAVAHYIDETGPFPVAKASLSQKNHLRLSWFPKKYLKKEEKPLIYADCQLNMYLGYETVMVVQDTAIRVEKSSIASVSFLKDPETVVMDVFSDKVRNWEVRDDGTLEVVFKHEITDKVDLQIKAKLGVLPDESVPVEFFKPQETKRIHGRLNVFSLPGYKLAVENQRNLKVEGIENGFGGVPQAGFKLQKSFSFLDGDFRADIARVPEEQRFVADIRARVSLTETVQTSSYEVNIDVKKNVLSEVKVRLPEGQKVLGVKAGNVADYIIQDGILTLPLQAAVQDRFSFSLELERELADFTHVDVQGIELLNAEKVTGTEVVLFPRGYDVTETGVKGLKSANIQDVLLSEQNAGARYAYTLSDLTQGAGYDILKKEPALDVINVYHTSVQDTRVHVDLLCLFNIKNAPVDHFDVIAPAALKDVIEIQGDGIKTILKKDLNEQQRVVMTVNTVSKIDHAYMLQVSFNIYFGRDKTFTMPRVEFPQVNNKTEFVSVETDTVYHVEPVATRSLQPTEPDMIPALPAGVDFNNILWAFQSVGSAEWTYSLKLQRLEREKLVKARIQREDIKTLIIPNGYALHEVQLKVDNRTLQFLPVVFPSQSSLWSLKVAGESVRASLDAGSADGAVRRYQIPLIKSGAGDRSFDIQIVYLTPIKPMRMFGRMNLAMIDTGDVPVEKTTWSFFVPENYALSYFKTNMEAIDVSVIEVEKTLDLAKEYKYWTGVARSSKGELREKAIFNRRKVMNDFGDQYSLGQTMQYELSSKQGDKKYNQALISKAQTKNVQILNEAQQIMDSNRAEVPAGAQQWGAAPQKASYDSTRRNVKGWQFKTRNFDGQEQVGQQISQYLQQEDSKQQAIKRKEEKADIRKAGVLNKSVSQTETWGESAQDALSGPAAGIAGQVDGRVRFGAESGKPVMTEAGTAVSGERPQSQGGYQASRYAEPESPALSSVSNGERQSAVSVRRELRGRQAVPSRQDADLLREDVVHVQQTFWGGEGRAVDVPSPRVAAPQEAPLEKKKSALLKGQRSIEIPFPEQGQRFSFKKLGGNPTMTFVYRKSGGLSRIAYLCVCVLALLGILKARQARFPFENVALFFGKMRSRHLRDIFILVVDSRWCKIITFVVMVPALSLGSPVYVITIGLASIFLVRVISRRRHKKLDREEGYSLAVFLKYFPSYVIVLASLLSVFQIGFLVFVGIATVLNFFVAAGYGLVTLFTKKAVQE